ncbi:MAG: hypothetical protein ACR2H1_14665, partial [Limisphaerales bacterium]
SGPDAADGGGAAAATAAVVFKEKPWNSGQILWCRQKFKASLNGLVFNTVVANMLNNTATLVEAATSGVGNGRSVYQNLRLECAAPSDYSILTNALKDDSVRDFYYYGHCNGSAIGFSEFVPDNGVTVKDLTKLLRNEVIINKATKRVLFSFRKPFRFVFIDGCNSASGWLPEAFGIFAIPNFTGNFKNRAYLGWKTTTKNSIANNSYLKFSQKFWEAWLDETEAYNRSIVDARDIAVGQAPGVNIQNLQIFGFNGLTWRE